MEHDGLPGAICVYLLEAPEPVLVDPGPSTCVERLRAALAEQGASLGDVRHLLLTHVHLDHAGAAGHLARELPDLAVHVHEDGARHLADPERLVASTRRTFGDAHDRLWGEVLPVPKAQLRAWRARDARPLPKIRPVPTPGHIGHHLAWEAERHGVLFAGDSLGIVLHRDAPTHPATPPPSLDVGAWRRTLVEALGPIEVDAFGATHFGLHRELHERRLALLERLDALARRVGRAMESGEDAERADAERFREESIRAQSGPIPRERVEHYFRTFDPAVDWRGMHFHLARNPGAAPAPRPGDEEPADPSARPPD